MSLYDSYWVCIIGRWIYRSVAMAKIKVLLADEDERYLAPLERRFIDGLGVNADINVITDKNYLNTFFSKPQSLDLLMINEDFYDSGIGRHNIGCIFLLCEQPPEASSTDDLDIKKIYKYTSVKEIYNEVFHSASAAVQTHASRNEETRMIMFYSPIGGIGTTSLAAGLCTCFARQHKRALFVGTDNLQTFGWIQKNQSSLDQTIAKLLSTQSEDVYEYAKAYIRNGSYDMLPPFQSSLSSLNLKAIQYALLLKLAKSSSDYSFIVVDLPSDFSEDVSKLLSLSDHTVIVTGQDSVSIHKLNCLLSNIDCSDQSRFYFVCNKYKESEDNQLVMQDGVNKIHIEEYINEDRFIPVSDIDYFANDKSLQKLALTFIA